MVLPDLVVDKEFTLHPPESPIMKDTAVIPLGATTNVVRQQMRGSIKEHVSGSKVIIDDCLLYSTSLSLALLLLEYYMRVYLKYRESFKRSKCDFLSERF